MSQSHDSRYVCCYRTGSTGLNHVSVSWTRHRRRELRRTFAAFVQSPHDPHAVLSSSRLQGRELQTPAARCRADSQSGIQGLRHLTLFGEIREHAGTVRLPRAPCSFDLRMSHSRLCRRPGFVIRAAGCRNRSQVRQPVSRRIQRHRMLSGRVQHRDGAAYLQRHRARLVSACLSRRFAGIQAPASRDAVCRGMLQSRLQVQGEWLETWSDGVCAELGCAFLQLSLIHI